MIECGGRSRKSPPQPGYRADCASVDRRVIREQGGTILAQDAATSAVWGMPGAVTNAGLAHKVLPLPAIAPEIIRLASRAHSEAREHRESVV